MINLVKYFISVIICIMFSKVAYSQQESGISFLSLSSWKEIIALAQKQDKMIFVSCHASWCKPCKKMDAEIFKDKKVGAYFDKNFLSIRLQLDTGKKDDEVVRSMYNLAKFIKDNWKINAYPTFLFFTPKGEIVHRQVGFLSTEQLIATGQDAVTPEKQYYRLVDMLQKGLIGDKSARDLAIYAKKIGDRETAQKSAQHYINNSIERERPDFVLMDSFNIVFLKQHYTLLKISSQLIKYIYLNQETVDRIVSKGFSDKVLAYVITKDLINPKLKIIPLHWKEIEKDISGKFGEYLAHSAVLDAQVKYYMENKDWNNYTSSIFERTNFMMKTILDYKAYSYLNNQAWEIFLYSTDKNQLETALKWSELTIRNDSTQMNWYDTKANILYKLGFKETAINIQEKASFGAPKNPAFSQNLEKMKRNLPTWIKP